MPRNYRKYTDAEFIVAVAKSKSITEVCKEIGLKPAGGNFNTIRRNIQKHKLDTSHFTGQGWSKGKQLKNIGNYARPYKIKEHLANKRGWKCENCGQDEWMDKPIPLECHHKDKDRTNNDESNLTLLCRNCHFWIHDKK